MSESHPGAIILIGFILVLLGFILPLLMVMGIILPTFPLSFFSFGAGVAGVLLGVVGTAYYVRLYKKKNSQMDDGDNLKNR
jgi:membrane protein implicated in regulation of membrane protease activity